MVVDLKRYCFELRPDLTRVCTVLGDWVGGAALVRKMGFARFGGPVVVGNHQFQPIALDFGPDSVDGWIARHNQAEVQGTLIGLPASDSSRRRHDIPHRTAARHPRAADPRSRPRPPWSHWAGCSPTMPARPAPR